jgi:lipoprotein NlpD
MGKLTSETPLATIFSCSPHRLKFMGFFLIGLIILSCSGLSLRDARPRGVYHRVKSGETLSAIARAYRVDIQELAEINNIRYSDRIETDSVIFVPDANQILDDIMIAARPRAPSPALQAKETPVKKETAVFSTEIPKNGAAVEGKRQPQPPAEAAAKDRPVLSRAAERDLSLQKSAGTLESGETAGPPARPKESGEKQEQIQFDKKRFIWPVKGTVVSPFGIQSNRMYFNGIRIAAGEGTPVQAAADGVVIFSAPLKDYGETIIIQHEDHYATVYAHLGIRTVQGEVRVKKGGRIAFIGKAAAKEEASLHFEIRQNNKARNPLFFLP